MSETRSGAKRSCGTPGGSNEVKMKKTLEPCPGQSREDCTDPKETEASCKNGVSTESKKLDFMAELSGKKESISRTIQMKLQNIQRLKASIVEARKARTRIQSEIRCASHAIISQFRQKEKELMDTLDGVSENQFGLLSDYVNQNETDIQLANQKRVVLKKMLGDNDLMELHPAHENLLSGLTEAEDQVVRIINDVFVSQDIGKVKKGIEDLSFGQLDCTFQDLHDRSSRPKLLNSTTVTLKKEGHFCHIFDIIVLDVEGIKTIVVSDLGNRKVKSFYVRNGKSCHSEYIVATPHDLIHLKQNQVMVSDPHTYSISILAVTPDLIYLSDINTSSCYRGLRVLTSSTLVGCAAGAIDILNMKGKKPKPIRSYVSRDDRGYDRLCVTRTGNILVSYSCPTVQSLVCLTPQGDQLWEHFPAEDGAFRRPSAVETTRTGDILLADYETSRVIQLTESGRFVKDILVPEDGLAPPTALYLYNERHLFVGSGGEVKEYLLP
ncbi:uncharacterized protein LOC124285489 [Haliotis rubra]|uniref:uncharacterized protein LOC124285489 n=1 Tax=Haliotis rubra TaxID=36100 RepID=UPI001EE5DD85|nr:uncharacterized protein LOC124285489 [Haliotis rubra]